MSEERGIYYGDRPTWAAQFFSRLNRYRQIARTKWWIPVLGIAVGLGVQYGLATFKPPEYLSIGRMIVSIKLSIPENSVYTEELSNFLGTQASLMQSQVVVNRARARIEAKRPNQPHQLVDLKVTVSPRTTIFVLQALGDDPQYVQDFLQASMEEYIKLKKEMREQTSDVTLSGLLDQAGRLEKDLRNCDDELSSFQGSNSVVLLQDQGNSAANYLAAVNTKLANLKSEYDLLKSLTLDENIERQNPRVSSPGVASEVMGSSDTNPPDQSTDADYLKAKQQILQLKAEQTNLGQFLRPKHPKMMALSDEIARREQLLDIYRQQGKEQLENKKKSLALQIKNLEDDSNEWDTKVLTAQRKAADYDRLKANRQRTQALYDRLLDTMRTLDASKQISPESVVIMEPACPAYPDRPRLAKSLLIGGLLGVAASFALLMLLNRLDDRMNSFTELEQLFDEAVLGQIPREKPGKKKGDLALLQLDDERHPFMEAYRNLRSSLLYMDQGGKRPQILLVSSSVPNEGKSMTAANLAITMAFSGSKVLLVDADLRKGALHSRFGRQSLPGFSEVLSQGVEWTSPIQATDTPNLSLLPRGTTTQQAGEWFLNAATKKFLKEAREKYDFVIIDTAPVMAADDVASIAPQVDGVLFVVRAEVTSARIAHASLDILYQRQVRVLGLVFNAVRTNSGDYYYYHRYKDYYRQYPST